MRLRELFLLLFLPLAGIRGADISVTADSVGRMAVAGNPELRAARSLIAEAEGRARMTGRLVNPELDGEFAGGPDMEGRVAIGLTQRFPLTSRLRLERELSGIQIEGAKLEVRERERQIVIAAREAFYALAAAREAVTLARQQTAVAREFAKNLKDGSAEGFGSSLDADQASIDAETLSVAEQPFLVDAVQSSTKLAQLFGMAPETAFLTKVSLVLPQTVPAKRAAGVRPDLQLAELAVRAGIVDVSLARTGRWEDVGIGIFAEGDQLRVGGSDVEPDTLIGVRFAVPLPLWQNGAGRVSEKEAARERQSAQLEALRMSVRADVAASHQIMSLRYEAASRMQAKLLQPARAQVANAEAAYARGEADIQAVFRARERLVQIESEALQARTNYFIANSLWLAALGEPTK